MERVLNYPNPFVDATCFQFDHNLGSQDLVIMVQIFTVGGRLVKTLESTVTVNGGLRRDNCLQWDGKDDFGDVLAKGVYLYRVKVRATNNLDLEGESDFERLVILR